MAGLVLGPLLRHVDARSATVWVETDAACTVTVAGASADTFRVAGRHYALVVVEGLQPGTATEYDVRLDGEIRWPLPESPMPPSRIRTLADDDRDLLLLFGSCRKPDGADPAERTRLGADALAAYAHRMRGQEESDWPDALALLGDQVYADETSVAMREWLAARRDVRRPPGTEIADFAEYAHLYGESWSAPTVRWLLSTVPTAMIFDDHDVRDDWNTSRAWRDAMERTSWWAERERGALMSYWIYQHIGNLSPAELAADPTYRAVLAAGRDGDAADVLARFAEDACRETDGGKPVRWSFRRDLGGVRLLVVDTRAGRILGEGARAMVGDGEFDWIESNAQGDYDHLLIGSSLPWLLPPTIADLQSANEAACRRPGLCGRIAERVRQTFDLEHWASFRASSDRLTRLIRRIAEGPPATVCVLSGDVHHVYAAEALFDPPVRSRVYQLVCSPLHNAVESWMRPVFRLAWWRPAARLTRLLPRSRGIPVPPVAWRRLAGPHFGNAIAALRISGRAAVMVVERTTGGPDDPGLEPVVELPLSTR